MPSNAVVDVIQDGRCHLGESPWWSGPWLSWTDILGNAIHRIGLDGSGYSVIPTPSAPGFAVPSADGRWVAGLTDGLAVRGNDGSWDMLWHSPFPTETHRINDGKPDSRGRIWFGLMSYPEKDPISALYRWDLRGAAQVRADIITSNGIGWSPDGTTMYHTDSIRRVIRAYDYDEATGSAANERVFATDPDGYVPDGLTVDAEGCVWSAKWDGNKIVRYAPDGEIDREIVLSVARPTSCVFVGDDLRTLAVTTAMPSDMARTDELDGMTLLLDPGAQGYPLSPAQLENHE